jgi:hypothetical protein
MTDVVNKSNAEENEEKQRTTVNKQKALCVKSIRLKSRSDLDIPLPRVNLITVSMLESTNIGFNSACVPHNETDSPEYFDKSFSFSSPFARIHLQKYPRRA